MLHGSTINEPEISECSCVKQEFIGQEQVRLSVIPKTININPLIDISVQSGNFTDFVGGL